MIFQLDARTPLRLEALGGKGCGLVRLLRAGFAVPEAWCLPADAYRESEERLSPNVEGALSRWWDLAHARFPDALWAVRSSATAEDLDEASFAGVYTTRLGVAAREELLAAVGECWAALHTDAARAYRDRAGLGHDVAIAVVLQRLVRPEVSGVLLTANPRRPFAGEIVIDAAYGLGEGIVSGKTHPDHFVLDRGSGKIREAHLGGKEIEVVYEKGEGVVDRDVAPEKRGRRSLSDAQLGRLHDLAREVSARIGPRQDLEWAFEGESLYILQQRPITNLPPENPKNVWTRRFGDEYLADYTTPLSQGLLTRWIAEDYFQDIAKFMGQDDLARLPPLRNHQGYSYLSGEFMAKFLRAAPKRMRGGSTMGWFTPLWERRLEAEPFEPRLAWGIVRAPGRDKGRGPLAENYKALSRHCANIDEKIVPKIAQDYTKLSLEEWKRQYSEVHALGSEHFRVIRWGMGFHNPMLHGALKKLLERWVDDRDGALYQQLVSGLPGTKTAEINESIWRLGLEARKDERLATLIRSERPLAEIRAESAQSPFWKVFGEFLARHGHRAATREISQPRWRETPEVILGFVRVQLHGAQPPPSPRVAEEQAVERRREAERAALKRAGRGPGGAVRKALLARLLRWVRIYTLYRENQRYHLDYLLVHVRNLVLEQGRRLTEAGVIAAPGEIFFLESEEFWRLIEKPLPCVGLSRKIEARLQHYLKWKDRLPATFLFDDVETEGEIVEGDPRPGAAGDGPPSGLGASRGTARGLVRIVEDLAHLKSVEPGEILVASNIDPGWTNVFPLLAGVVTETGGILSHGALLAREYGIPAVMGVPRARTRFRTGQVIEIDGAAGTIRSVEG